MNTKSLLPIILVGLVAGTLGAAAGLSARDDTPPPRTNRAQAGRFDRLETEIANLQESLRGLRATASPALVAKPEATLVSTTPDTTVAETETDGLQEFERLRNRVITWKASAEESARFWELARTSKLLPQLIDRLKEAVKADPDRVAARLQLARAYVAKLYTVPNGPERGVWAVQAEGQWREVLKRDDANWDARFSLAFSLSQWPAFFNKAPDAIREFESLMTQQEAGRLEPRQARVYAQLAQMYRGRGQTDKAAAALKRGLARHPDDAALKSTIHPE